MRGKSDRRDRSEERRSGKPRASNLSVSERTLKLMETVQKVKGKKKKDPMKLLETSIPKDIRKGDLRDEFHKMVKDAEDEESPEVSNYGSTLETLGISILNNKSNIKMDAASQDMQAAALGMVLSMIPIAEIAYRKNKRESSAYALNAFINQARELMNDMKMASDTNANIEYITRIIISQFLQIGQMLITETSSYKARIESEVTSSEKRKVLKSDLDNMTMSFGKFLSETQGLLLSRITAYFNNDPSELMPVKALGAPVSKKRKKRVQQ